MKNKKQIKFNWFTLVELIVVIVILAILATIAFLSFNSHSSSARDSLRMADILNISKWLTVQYTIWWKYIIPDSYVTIYSWSSIIWYQWKAWVKALKTIKMSVNSGLDPYNSSYYSYNINLSQNNYQLTWFLENKIQNSSFDFHINKTTAQDYSWRYPYIKWGYLWSIMSLTWTIWTNNVIITPIEDSWTWIDVTNSSHTNWKIVLYNSLSYTWVNSQTIQSYIINSTTSMQIWLSYSNPWLSCKDIKNINSSSQDWVYWIKPDANSSFQVYCDMSNDGGWYTIIARLTNNDWSSNWSYWSTNWSWTWIFWDLTSNIFAISDAKSYAFSSVNWNNIMHYTQSWGNLVWIGKNSNLWWLTFRWLMNNYSLSTTQNTNNIWAYSINAWYSCKSAWFIKYWRNWINTMYWWDDNTQNNSNAFKTWCTYWINWYWDTSWYYSVEYIWVK